jgi:NTE family protein
MKITTALGGGGVKCYAQFGILKTLLNVGVRLGGISGTSGGAIVGAYIAADLPLDDFPETARLLELDRDLHRRPGDGPGIFGLTGLKKKLRKVFGDLRMEELPLPLAIACVDWHTRREFTLRQGDLVEGLLAGVAIPGLFPPQPAAGRLMIDGGQLNPIPVTLARETNPALPVLALALFPPEEQWNQHPFPRFQSSRWYFRFLKKLNVWKAFNHYVRATDMTHRTLALTRLELDRPAWVINPPVHHLSLLDDVDIHGLIRIGEKSAQAWLNSLQEQESEQNNVP